MAAGERGGVSLESGGAARRRVVLLGASNLVHRLPAVLRYAREAWGAPLDIYAAIGHGRSYGGNSRVFGRVLPGILQAGIWPALADRASQPTAALVSDVGNDLLYGASPQVLLQWIEECLRRLAALRSRTILSLLPLASVESLPSWRYRLIRRLLFPGCKLSLQEVLARAKEVQSGLQELAPRFGATLIEPRAEWYGFDPIHITRRASRTAWAEIFSEWKTIAPDSESTSASSSISESLRAYSSPAAQPSMRFCYSLRPERRIWFGREQHRVQPCGTLRDGTSISLY